MHTPTTTSATAVRTGIRPANPVAAVVPLLLKSCLVRPAHTIAHQFARYLIVGGVAFLVDFGSLYLLTEWFGLYYLLSAAVAFLLGLTTNYLLSRVWVFDRRTMRNTTLEFLVFAVIGVVGLGLTEAIMWFVREQIHLHYLIAKAISTGVVLVWNFGARKALLFR